MNNEYYEYLDALRESGVVNMFGAGTYLQDEFGNGLDHNPETLGIE